MRATLEKLLTKVVAASKRGEFTLSSGKTSDFYFDGRLVTLDPYGGLLVGDEMLSFIDSFRDDNVPTALGGPAAACIPIATAAATLLAYRVHDPKIRKTFFVRSEAKGHGTKKMIEGPELTAEDRVILVDDTLTTGGSLVRASDAVRATGAKIVGAWVLLDREEGGRKALMDADIPHIHALFRKTDVFAAMDKAVVKS